MSDLCPCKQWLRAKELGIPVGQDLEELLQFYEYLPEKIEHVLEIGTEHGGWLFMLASVIKPPARLCAVDYIYQSEFSVARSELANCKFNVTLIQSEAVKARAAVAEWLGFNRLDVLHLDAQHDIKGARREWELYYPLVRSGGVVAIHDVMPTGPHAEFGSQFLFHALDKSFPKTYLCQRTWREGLGIGVVHIP